MNRYLFIIGMVGVIAIAAFDALGESSEEPRFIVIQSNVAVANKAMCETLKNVVWESATDVWVPTSQAVLAALDFIGSPKGADEVISKAPRGVDMRPCVASIVGKRFQVFGLIVDGKKCILFDGIPQKTALEATTPDLWLKNSISRLIVDGGADFWSILYDSENGHIISSGRRPN